MQFVNYTEPNYQTKFLQLDEGDDVSKIFHSYDFFGLTETLEESLVVLMMLLDLDINDILYLSSKQDRHFLTGDR